MSWTYDSTQLAISELYQVRFLIGDTDTSDQLLSDQEIEYLLDLHGSVSAAAIASCENLSAKYARQVDYRLGPQSVSASKRAEQFEKLAIRIKKQSSKYSVPTVSSDQHDAIFDINMMDFTSDTTQEEEAEA